MIKSIKFIPEGRDQMFKTEELKNHLRRIIRAKATLYEEGDEMKLIEKAVRAYVPDVEDHNCLCGGKTKLQFQDREKTVFANSEPTTVSIKNAPVFVCESCGEEYSPLRVYAFLEQEIEEDILKHLRTRKEPPVEYDFLNDFMNAKE